MSRRPNVKSAHERIVERAIQATHRTRAQAVSRALLPGPAATDAPYIRCYGRGAVKGDVPAGVQQWIASEAKSQLGHYRRIATAMARLAPLRDRWVQEFFARITSARGYSINAGQRRTIARSELPVRPRRTWRVVW